jgi:3-oxoacyl-[acyl-carrier protein] reductase
MIDLSGKVALITGASRGIGAAAALKLAEAGASVAVNYLEREAEASKVVAAIRSRGARAIAIRADVSSYQEVGAMFERAVAEFGQLDILVANAGIWEPGPIEELTPENWQRTIDINLKGVYLSCHFAARLMKPRRSGRIITISSTAGQRGEAFYCHYAASKGGIISLTKSLAAELGPHGITVNCVAPGWVDTDMSASALADPVQLAEIIRTIPIGRIASAQDVAGPIVFLASELARHINGEVLNVNGGSVLCG